MAYLCNFFASFSGFNRSVKQNFPNGGCWTLRIKKKSPVIGKWWEELVSNINSPFNSQANEVNSCGSDVCELWIYQCIDLIAQLFAAIGETLQEPDIVGVSVSVKPKEEIFSIWNRDASAKPRVG